MAEISLLKAARALDQDGPETVASKLSRFWSALAATTTTTTTTTTATTARFHAAEAIALRWLLKNMAGSDTAPEAETLRRWPMTWRIMACLLRRIPLFSLAKALADRRFVAVLQQTARELAAPAPETPPSCKRKRKRAPSDYADLATLRTPQQCRVSAAALFAALRVLLGRLAEGAISNADKNNNNSNNNSTTGTRFEHMGAEHIKTLFSVPATEAMTLLVPLLRMGNLALTAEEEDEEDEDKDTDVTEDTLDDAPPDQSAWVAVVAALWDLHAPGPTDAVEVATHLAPFGFAMLGGVEDKMKETTDKWATPLRRFLTNNVVLPARAAFLNRNDTQILALAAGDPATSRSVDGAVRRSAVLLDLAVRAPTPVVLAAAAAAARNNAQWLRMVVDKITGPFMAAAADDDGTDGTNGTTTTTIDAAQRNTALAQLLERAAQHGVAPSARTLRWIAGHAALGKTGARPRRKGGRRARKVRKEGRGKEEKGEKEADDEAEDTDWRLLAAVARCDADVFLVAPKDDGDGDGERSLLDTVLARLVATTAFPEDDDDAHHHAAQFLVALARAFARARNLAGFVTRWARALAASSTPPAAQHPWRHPGVRAAVADALQPSLTKEQVVALVEDVVGASEDNNNNSDEAAAVARVVVFDALSAGVSLEEYEDAVQTKMVDAVVVDSLTSLPTSALALCWRLVRRTLAWVGADEAARLWVLVHGRLEGEKQRKQDLATAFEALVCAFSFWMALKLSGPAEAEARETTWRLFRVVSERLGGMDPETLRAADHNDDLDLATTDESAAAAAVLTWMLAGSSRFVDEMVKSSDAPSPFLDRLVAWQAGGGGSAVLLLANATNLQNTTVVENVTARYVQKLQTSSDDDHDDRRDALLGLLRLPSHLLVRPLRETVVGLLLPPEGGKKMKQQLALPLDDTVLVLDLLTRVLLRDRATTSASAASASGGRVDLARLRPLAEGVHAGLGRGEDVVALPTALGVLDRLQRLATVVAGRGVVDSADSKEDWFVSSATPVELQLIFLRAQAASNNAEAADRLASLVVKQLRRYLEKEEEAQDNDDDVTMTGTDEAGSPVLPPVPVLLALDAALADGPSVETALRKQKKLRAVADKAGVVAVRLCRRCRRRAPVGWTWKALHARYAAVAPPRDVLFEGLFSSSPQTTLPPFATPASLFLDRDLLRTYLAAATRDSSPADLLAYVQDVIRALPDGAGSVAPLLAIQSLLDRFLAAPSPDDAHTLASIHSHLVRRLPRCRSATAVRLLAHTLRTLLLDDKTAAVAMGQWNVDATLGGVAVLARDRHLSSPEQYDAACSLVEAVLKRHRVRLEGRFPLLVRTLQSLLAALVQGKGGDAAHNAWPASAKRFSRLLELVCEPSTAAVTRIAGATALTSATDTAKRSAGQHMYLVLMTYLQLQIDGAVVGRGVRAALEPGLFSVLTITPDDTRRLLNDAVDAGGRALFRDLYRRWLRFGKWRGV